MKCKNQKSGFVGMLALILIVALSAGGGIYVYQNNKLKGGTGNYNYPATSTTRVVVEEEASARLTPPSSEPVTVPTVTSQANIVWSFPVIGKSESHSTYNIIVIIDGKKYDLKFGNSWGAKEIEKSKLLPNQLSAVRSGNGDSAVEFAVQKTTTGYVITKATYDYRKDGAEDSVAWRQRTSVYQTIGAPVKSNSSVSVNGNTLSVIVDGKAIQTLALNSDGIAAKSFSNVDSFITNQDVNFDGHNDIGVLSGTGYMGVNSFYDYYLFNSTTGSYDKNKSLEGVILVKVDPLKKQLINSYKSGPGYETQTIQWNGSAYIKSEPKSAF